MKQPTLEQRIEAIESVVEKLCFCTGDVGLLNQTLEKVIANDALVDADKKD